MKFKNIAVVLRGHVRTWQYNAPAAFEFYDSIAENVDYYFSTWNTPKLRAAKVRDTFERGQKELKIFKRVDYHDREYTSWGGPAMLSLHIVPYVRQQHKQTPYDAVFDSRPDVLPGRPARVAKCPITPIQENTLYTTMFTNLLDRHGNRNVGMMDHMLVSKFEVFEGMCDRFIVDSRDTKECHVDMLEFAKRQNYFVSSSLPWMDAIMTRPADMHRVLDPRSFFAHTYEAVEKYPTWESCTIEQRLELLSLYDIEDFDYITNNGNIAIENVTDETRDRILGIKTD